jgi:hypothetical protein
LEAVVTSIFKSESRSSDKISLPASPEVPCPKAVVDIKKRAPTASRIPLNLTGFL